MNRIDFGPWARKHHIDNLKQENSIVRNLYWKRRNFFDAIAGSEVKSCITEAIAFAKRKISFECNGVIINVRRTSNSELIDRDWWRAMNDCISKNVGPHPNPVLTETEKTNDAYIEAVTEQRIQKHRAAYQAAKEANEKRVEAKLVGAPNIEVTDEAAWKTLKDSIHDDCGRDIISYLERWARLMQIEMAEGKNLEDVADTTSDDADFEGMSGSTYRYAINTLFQWWKHGKKLRQWDEEK